MKKYMQCCQNKVLIWHKIILTAQQALLLSFAREISLTNAHHGSWTTWLNNQACLDKFGLAAVCGPSWGCSGCWLISRDLAKDRYNNIPSLSTKSRARNLPTASECWANREEYVVLTANRNSGLYINRTDCQITECVLFWGALGLVSDLFVHEDKQLEINEQSLECVTAWAHGLWWYWEMNASPWVEQKERVKVAEAGYCQHVLSWTWSRSPIFSYPTLLFIPLSTHLSSGI